MKVQKDNYSSLLKEIQDIHREIKGFIRKHMRLPHPHDLFEVVGRITLDVGVRDPLKDDERHEPRFDLSEGDTITIDEFDGVRKYRGVIMYNKNGAMHEVTLDCENVHNLIKGGWIELVATDDDK